MPAADSADYPNWTEVKRLDVLAGTEVVVVPPDVDADEIDLRGVTDDSGLSNTKKCLDGSVCSQGERWGT